MFDQSNAVQEVLKALGEEAAENPGLQTLQSSAEMDALRKDYKSVFGSAAGKLVLADITQLGFISPTYDPFSMPADQAFHTGLFKEGQKSIVRRILQLTQNPK